LYSRDDLGSLDWPATEDGDYARRYLTPFMTHGPHTYLRNARAAIYALRAGPVVLPVTVSDFDLANSYVCSPYAHYVTYGQEELFNLKNPPVEAAMRLLFRPLAWYFRRGALDRAVLVNNWLLSTNLYPSGVAEHAAEMVDHLAAAFPDRAVIFRSVDARANADLLAALRASSARPVFSRRIYYQDVSSTYVQRRRDYRADLKCYQRTPYQVLDGADLGPADAGRIVELYADLYLRKYSYCNPQFTPEFVRLALAERLLTIKAFARDGRIDAALGYFGRGGYITAPLFGYDTQLPKELGLYRLLTMRMSLDALEHGWTVHLSAGVGRFKRLRGGLPVIEYNAVFDGHLPASRRRPWRLLQVVTDRLAIPIIQKYEF
jgi:hypothetical protein